MSERYLHSVDDLSLGEVAAVLARAAELEEGAVARTRPGLVVGLLFLAPSLRTRVGFAVAATRLGASSVTVAETRGGSEMSGAERLGDTVRTVSGMVDALVVRTPGRLPRDELKPALAAPGLNGGDGDGEHPSQALIDLHAIERARGPVSECRVGICGDLTGRSCRSLLRLLSRMPPRELILVAPPGRDDPGDALAPQLAARAHRAEFEDTVAVDVLYLAGLPEGSGGDRLDEATRRRYALTSDRMRALAPDTLVLSPMPVIDEISPAVRADPRIRFFEQSDRGVHVRTALLELLLFNGENQ